MRVDTLTITYKDDEGKEQKETIHVRRLKFRRRAAIFEELKGDMPPETENIFSSAPIIRQAQFVVEMISESVCDSDGKLLYPIDAKGETEIDDWADLKRNAYSSKIIQYQSPKMEDAAKNSSSTANAPT